MAQFFQIGGSNAAESTNEAYFGNIHSQAELEKNLSDNCIPADIFDMDTSRYQEVLAERRLLMARKIWEYYNSL